MSKKQEKSTEQTSVIENVLKAEPVVKSNYKWEKERLHDRKPVKGIFRFHEVPGGSLTFSYLKYKGDPIESFVLKDGDVYTLPLGVAKHLRSSGWYPVHAFEVDEMGVPNKRIGQRVKRYTFEPLDFVADDKLNDPYLGQDKNIITVNKLA